MSKKNRNYPDKKEINTTNEEEIINNENIENKVEENLKNTIEIDNSFSEDVRKNKNNINKHPFVHFFLIILLFVSLGFFVVNLLDKDSSINTVICSLLLTIFTILFVTTGISYNRKTKGMIFVGSLLLMFYFLLGINNIYKVFDSPIATVEDFSGKSITYVIKWAHKNNVLVNQEYEYSDMVPEYSVISQNIKSGTSLGDTKEITVAISEGSNPYKEIVVPSMVSWDCDRVIKFIEDNHLENVIVDFTESDKERNTVIEQSVTGNMKRNDELKILFSYGEEVESQEVKLIDFTGKSKFEVEFYLKQHKLRYGFKYDFSKKIKKGFAISQEIKPGETVHVLDERIEVTFSKGPEIKVPDLKKYDVTKITEWAIKNKLKLNFTDKYDDSIKENNVISANYEKDDIIEQGTVVKVVLSRGSLKMKKFKSINDFYDWANKYEIKYEEEHEFSDTVKAGEVISYSYKAGEAIKNNDTIIVKISDGSKKTVPNLKGLTKSEAISKLDKVDLNYSFVYRNSNDVEKGKVINQSISSGSEVSSGTTITVTISNGKGSSSNNNSNTSNNNNNNNNNNTSNNNNNDNNTNNNNNNSNNNDDNKKEEEKPKVEEVTVYIYDELIKSSPSATCSAIKGAYPKLKFSCSYVCGPYNGALVNSSSIDEKTFSTDDTITLKISDSEKC